MDKLTKYYPIFNKNYKPPENPLKSIQIDFCNGSEKESPKRRRKTKLGKEPIGMCQMVLDAGQKKIGPEMCIECGLLFSRGDVVDEQEHAKAHSRLENLFTLRLWKDPEILKSFIDGGNILRIKNSQFRKGRLHEFLLWMDSELGTGSDSSNQRNEVESQIFLYILPTKRKNDVRILGCLIVEPIVSENVIAYRIQKPGNDENAEFENGEEVSINIGITRLWTEKFYRRKSIASRLCDEARFHSAYGIIVPKSKFGILEPSSDGQAFFQKYTQSEGAMYSYKSTVKVRA